MSPMSPRLLRPRQIGFDPRTIANLVFWLDANDSSTIDTASGAVSEWRSRVGSAKATQGTANNRPALTTAGRNGRNVITFDGSNDFLSTGTLSINQPFTIFWVGSTQNEPAPSVSPSRGPYICDSTTSSNRVIVGWNASGNVADNGRLLLFAGTVVQPPVGAYAYNAWSAVAAVFNGASSVLRANGTELAAGNAGSTNIAALNLGNNFQVAASTSFNGPWGAFLIYDRALSTSEIQIVERGFGALFGIAIA